MDILRIKSDNLPEHHEAYYINLTSKRLNYKLCTILDKLSQEPILGLDTEWKPNTKVKQTVLQLSGNNISVVCYLGAIDVLNIQIIQILENPRIKKCGCGIQDDVAYLSKRFCVDIRGIQDLEILADFYNIPRKNYLINGISSDKGLRGLVSLYNWVLGLNLPKKNKQITLSDWSRYPLTPEQIEYALFDAVMSYRIGYFFCQIQIYGGTTQRVGSKTLQSTK